MEDTLVAPATPTDEPVTQDAVTPAEPTAEPSIAEHEAQFGRNKPEPAEAPVEKPRHRAQSQKATPADAPRIAELTKKWRDAERERDEWKSKASSRPEPVAPVTPIPAATPSPVPVAEKSDGEPDFQAYENQVGTKYQTWAEMQNAFMRDWRTWDRAESQREQQTVQQRQQQEQTHQATLDTYVSKAKDFATRTPDFFERTAAVAQDFDAAPQLLQAAVITADNGPELAYYLATHPDTLIEMSLLTHGKAVNPTSVALVQRRLASAHARDNDPDSFATYYRQQTAKTGSVAPIAPRSPAPRPPNPVRTSAMPSTDDLPGDDASIAEHQRVWGKKRR